MPKPGVNDLNLKIEAPLPMRVVEFDPALVRIPTPIPHRVFFTGFMIDAGCECHSIMAVIPNCLN